MIGWLFLLAGGGYAAYKYATGLDEKATARSVEIAVKYGGRGEPPTYKGTYRERLLQALQWRESDRDPADRPSLEELRSWITKNDAVIAIAQRHRRPVAAIARELSKDGGGGHYLYRAFPNEKIPKS